LFLKNFQRFKKNKTPDTQARQKSTRQMTQTEDIKMVVTHDRQRTPAYNSTYPKGGVSCSKDSFVVNGSLVFQIKFCGKSPALRVAAKR
jgi:hypothetical protein